MNSCPLNVSHGGNLIGEIYAHWHRRHNILFIDYQPIQSDCGKYWCRPRLWTERHTSKLTLREACWGLSDLWILRRPVKSTDPGPRSLRSSLGSPALTHFLTSVSLKVEEFTLAPSFRDISLSWWGRHDDRRSRNLRPAMLIYW